MNVKVKAVGGKTFINQPYTTPADVCFDVWGTTLSPKYSACTLTDGCYKQHHS